MPDFSSSRREFLHLAGLGLASWPLTAARAARRQRGGSLLVYVGTYAPSGADSVFLFRLDPKTGALTRLLAHSAGDRPSFLALSADRRFLYTANEVNEYQGAPTGFVSAFAIDQRTGGLTALNQQPSGGGSPCYVSLAGSGRAALVANYGGGSVSILPVTANGTLQPPAATRRHRGAGPNPDRQTAPHAHCIIPDPAGRFAFAADLGTDQVLGYRLDAPTDPLMLLPQPAFTARPGAGPRHLTFHPTGRWAYLVNELTSSISALAYDAQAGTFREVHTVAALPAGFAGANTCADIHVAPSGRFVYASNRGHDSIVVLAVDAGTGRLTVVQHQSTQGQTPRNFGLDPSGTVLLVANQKSDTLVSFFVNAKTGRLTPTGRSAEVPAPVCVQVVPDFITR